MIYLDTNVLLRIITQDLPEQAQEAYDFIENERAEQFMILDSVLVETTFILQYHDYKMPKREISQALLEILAFSQIAYEGKDTLAALKLFASQPKLDFVDCLLLSKSSAKSRHVLTFDKQLRRKMLQ